MRLSIALRSRSAMSSSNQTCRSQRTSGPQVLALVNWAAIQAARSSAHPFCRRCSRFGDDMYLPHEWTLGLSRQLDRKCHTVFRLEDFMLCYPKTIGFVVASEFHGVSTASKSRESPTDIIYMHRIADVAVRWCFQLT